MNDPLGTKATESEVIMEIERLELQARQLRRKAEHAKREEDRVTLDRLLREIEEQVERLRERAP